ncbi:Na+/H+ antiporter NhaC [Paenibacillus odorifer]|jgi:NhaC family Na+:H+ antiporter|uniref:Na+/H+ antiporter NhaC n=1 Tax=Paenibacillus TaxID=44249 RepID=UPI00096D6BEA|nr:MULTISPECIES: Na+/H+ antiporter NhaC [Paenibacillus]MDH6427374.1 NhaC family Na+:H+ antiporter [Paenibacillus sp. PastH-4]MDH6443404.1 NhaC family Na+:H+ antiporter [Paenibacillus sp. PastF-4]MDH6525892.1 NhaC family Na+:H+ antiporter [Paenibacillus sp. PastH-3]OMD66459.1 Na+/H+ antiporter NhaC [Paenibacillus odorifer]
MDRQLSFSKSMIIIAFIFALLFVSIFLLKAEPHIPLLATTVGTAVLLGLFGVSWKDIEAAIIKGIQTAIMPILILMLIGILIAVWMMSGTVPTLLFYGMDYINPNYFAVSALYVTIVVSMFTGSSFTTVSTIGVALMGIALTTGISPTLAAGAIICGACFGDKMSPLSDTTNFAPAVVGISLFTHIRNMMYTTIPALIITTVFFLFAPKADAIDLSSIQGIKFALQDGFHIHWLTLISPLAVIICSIKRIPILPTLIVGIVTGLLVTAIIQQQAEIGVWFSVMQNGYESTIANETVASIVNRGGMQSMMSSVSLILIALSLGGLIQHCGVIEAFFRKIIQPLKRKSSIVLMSGASSIAVNGMTGEQYLSILLPGQMFKDEYNRRGIPAKTLSRTLEDCGTLVNPLIPWGVSGAFFAATLGVPVIEYIPYATLLWLSPFITFAYALIPKLQKNSLG